MKPEKMVARADEIAERIRDDGHHLHFDYVGVSTAYRTDETVTAEWIRRFFEGYFAPSDATEADVTVYSTGDSALFTALQGLAPQHAGTGKYGYTEVPVTDSVTVVRKEAGKVLPREDVFLLLFEKERRIVVVTSGNPDVRREEGMQTLRAVSKWLLLERGWIPMHSACAAKNGRTICVTGGKASGKTSTLLNLLARNGCDLVAVDKFLIRDNEPAVEVCGIPGKIGVRVGTAIVQPRILDWLARTPDSFFPHISSEEVRQIAATNTPEQLRTRSEKVHLLPAELAELFGGSITPTAPLGLMLIPVFDLDVESARLIPAGPEQAIGMLENCYAGLLSKGEGFLLRLFDLSDALLQERLAALLGTHLPGVATYEVHQNHRTNEQAAELVGGLL